jgi:hypothetical protein
MRNLRKPRERAVHVQVQTAVHTLEMQLV